MNKTEGLSFIFAMQACIWYTQVITLARWVPKEALIFVYLAYMIGLYFVDPSLMIAMVPTLVRLEKEGTIEEFFTLTEDGHMPMAEWISNFAST